MKQNKGMDKEHEHEHLDVDVDVDVDVHMDQELNLEVGMVDEGWEGTYMGLDTCMEKKMNHNYP